MTYSITGGAVLTREVRLTTTGATVLIPEGGATIIGIYAAERAGATPSLAYWKVSGGTNFYLRGNKPMTAYEAWRDEVIVVLKRDETLMAQATAANQIDVIVSYIPADRTAK
jgi:hypothetical protein